VATAAPSLAGCGYWSVAPPPKAGFGSLDCNSRGTEGPLVVVPARFSSPLSGVSSELSAEASRVAEDLPFFSETLEMESAGASMPPLPGIALSECRISPDFEAIKTGAVLVCVPVETDAELMADWASEGEVAGEELVRLAVELLGSWLFAETDLVGAKLRMVKETTANRRTPIKALVTCPILDPAPGDFFA